MTAQGGTGIAVFLLDANGAHEVSSDGTVLVQIIRK